LSYLQQPVKSRLVRGKIFGLVTISDDLNCIYFITIADSIYHILTGNLFGFLMSSQEFKKHLYEEVELQVWQNISIKYS